MFWPDANSQIYYQVVEAYTECMCFMLKRRPNPERSKDSVCKESSSFCLRHFGFAHQSYDIS